MTKLKSQKILKYSKVAIKNTIGRNKKYSCIIPSKILFSNVIVIFFSLLHRKNPGLRKQNERCFGTLKIRRSNSDTNKIVSRQRTNQKQFSKFIFFLLLLIFSLSIELAFFSSLVINEKIAHFI